ncbi:hypothetical protein ARMGADRAFT_1088318 [Armillaria gallica]|uniref:JmjC domain-containing protein n=1 Tax=Armillaria gallica TaxID=47427 RepID=A0A2H3DAN3_ARMGA|nr:hypothetical protein ARMGADRAFT_1088318 [Armillaria gallica]
MAGFVASTHDENLLARDTSFIQKISQTAPIQDQTKGSIRVLTQPFPDKTALFGILREAASKNQVVVLHNYVPILAHGELSVEFLQSAYNISPYVEVEEHDSVKKQTDNLNPRTPTTIGQFVRDITDPMKSTMILDLPVPRDTVLAEFHNLDDGSQAMAHTKTLDTATFQLLRELVTDRTWALLHQAGVLTGWHRDTDGKLTIILVDRGCKFWIQIRPRARVTRAEIDLVFEKCLDADEDSLDDLCADVVDARTLLLLPRDVGLQPAAAIHGVYTPVPTLAKGSSFWSYDSMHITEVTRRHDAHAGDMATNVDHISKNTLIAFI